jgi:hypothetical protein
MDNLLFDFALLTVGAYSLIISAVLLTVSLDVDGSYVGGDSCVVFIIDTTHISTIRRGVQLSVYLPLTPRRKWVVTVAVALAYVALSVVQEELRLILTGSLSTCLLSLFLSGVYG